MSDREGPEQETIIMNYCNGCSFLDSDEDDWGIVGAVCKKENKRIPHMSLGKRVHAPDFCPFLDRKENINEG